MRYLIPLVLLCACTPHPPTHLAIVLAPSAWEIQQRTGPASVLTDALQAAGWEVRAIELPCHGEQVCEAHGPAGWTPQGLSEFCARLERIAGARPATLIGIGQGAEVATMCDPAAVVVEGRGYAAAAERVLHR